MNNTKRVSFYFDGFNFYNGLKEKASFEPKWKNYYWINFVELCRQFMPLNEIVSVKYFTAPPSNLGARSRQGALLGANQLLNPYVFEIIKGNYQNKSIECKKCKQLFTHPEEKRTDVNIATTMLLDCFKDITDTLILVSADSDQVPTIKAIKDNFPSKNVRVYFPPNRSSADLLYAVKNVVYLENNEKKFIASLMNSPIALDSKIYTKPEGWTG